MAQGIISGFDANEVKTFNQEIIELVRVSKEMDRYYGRSHSDLDIYLKKYEKWLESFNKKYKGIKLKVIKKIDILDTKFLLNEKSIKETFDNSVSKIDGLKSAGINRFGEIEANNPGFLNFINSAKSHLLLTFFDSEIGLRSIFLSMDNSEKMVRLNYDKIRNSYEVLDILYDSSPDFMIACFYALKNEHDNSIDLISEGASFGFDDLLSEREKAEFYHRMNPEFME